MFCVDNATMKASDIATIQSGTTAIELMKRVADNVWKVFFTEFLKQDNEIYPIIYIICGKGNNGGDGLAIACAMLNNGIVPQVFLTEQDISDDSNFFLQKIKKNNPDIIHDILQCDYKSDIIIDCIFGTGFRGKVMDNYTTIINNINNCKAYKLSIDIPSGLNGDNGLCDIAIKANKTIAIQCPKVGCFLSNGKDYCGQIDTVDIGINIIGKTINIVDCTEVESHFLKRKNNSNKSTFGKSLILGGCINFLGAVKLANMGQAALRSGCGLNVIATAKSMAFSFLATQILESTIFPLDDNNGYISFNQSQIDKCLLGVNSIIFGVGIGDDYAENIKILRHILLNYAINVVIDADGLNALSKDISILSNSKCNIILTPHPKEMARLCGLTLSQVLDNPLAIAKDFATRNNVCLLLKGASTLVCNGDKDIAIITNGSPSLSKGGSGDTLSGAILGLLSWGLSCFDACRVGAYLCAAAAKNAEITHSEYGVLPSDVSAEIAKIVNSNLKI